MTAKIWDNAFEILIESEGDFSDDKRDKGNWTSGKIGIGELKGTKYGISAMAYPDVDIENLTLEQAKGIYKKDYWDRCKCDYLPDALSVAVFDFAVNSGVNRAIKYLQLSLGVTADGIIGNQTLGACNRLPIKDTLNTYMDERLEYLTSLKDFKYFGNGWGKRVERVRNFCERLI